MNVPSVQSDSGRAARRLTTIGLGVFVTLVATFAQADEFPLRRLPATSAGPQSAVAPVAFTPSSTEGGLERLPFYSANPPVADVLAVPAANPQVGLERLPFYYANPPVADALAVPAATPQRALERLPYSTNPGVADAVAVPTANPQGGFFRLAGLQDPESDPAKKQPENAAAANNAEPRTLGQAPISYTMQFLRDETVLLDPGAWQFDTGAAYTYFENDFPVAVVDGGGAVVGVIEGMARQRLLYSPFALRYGLSCNVQLFGALPVGWENTQVSTIGASDGTDTGGLGDLTAGANFHLCQGDGYAPDVIATGSFTAPTGEFSAPIFGLVPGSALGQGFWAAAGQLLFIHRYDPIIVFYGAGYRHLFERHFDGVNFTAGEQISYQFGVGFAANDRVTLSAILQGFYITSTSLDGVNLPGTNLEPISLRFAATVARNSRILEPFASVGMTDSAPAASVGVVVTFY